jgi:hypothetical protein
MIWERKNLMEIPAGTDQKAWKQYWREQRQPWRRYPPVSAERQAFLQQRIEASSDGAPGPFAGIRLYRADIECLLEWHDQGRGPVWWKEEYPKVPSQRRDGLNLCGAMLSGEDLSHLPLCRTFFGLTWDEAERSTPRQLAQAAAHLQGANLRGANLEGIRGRGAHLEGACLAHTR